MSDTEVTIETQTDDLDAFTSEFFGENKKEVTEAAKPAEVEQEEQEGEDSTQTTSELTDEEVEAEEAPKPKSRVQERIDELVKQREDTKRDAERQIAAIRKEFDDALKALKPTQAAPKSAEPQPDAVSEDGSAKYPLGEFDPLYIRDLTRYTLEEERVQANIKADEQRKWQEQASQKAALKNSWDEKLETAKQKYPDLVEKGNDLLSGFSSLNQDYAEYLSTVLMSMDFGPDVLNYLANNRDEATKIVNSGAQKATLALGRIESKFMEAEQTKQLAKPKVSKAPPPPTATARGTGGGAKTIEADTDDLDAFTQEFFRSRR